VQLLLFSVFAGLDAGVGSRVNAEEISGRTRAIACHKAGAGMFADTNKLAIVMAPQLSLRAAASRLASPRAKDRSAKAAGRSPKELDRSAKVVVRIASQAAQGDQG
jgi:hypothetical protein